MTLSLALERQSLLLAGIITVIDVTVLREGQV